MPENLAERVANTAVGEHLARKIKHGDPDTGWEGDPFLVLTYDEADGYWRVWDTVNGYPDLVCKRKSDGRELDTRSLTAGLRDASLRRQSAQEILKRVEDQNALVEAAAQKAQDESISAQVEQIAYGIRKSVE